MTAFHRHALRRLATVLATCWLPLGAATAAAQSDVFFVPGRNVNTVGAVPRGGGPNPQLIGNPRHKQRNEVSCDVSPNNALVAFCANNDYRGVEIFGDSWIGLSFTTNGGLTWTSRLMEGFPASASGVGAADPVVRTVPGLGLVNYITISRTDGRGTLSLAVFLERNKENGEPYTYLDTRLIGNGTPGRFNDKPTMLAVLDPAGGTTTVGDRTVARGTVHVAYSIFPGNENNSSSQIFHLMSPDYGRTWTSPRKLSESVGINQGVELAVEGSTVVAVWRRVKDTNEPDAIMTARSTDGGQTWSKASVLWTPPNNRPGTPGIGRFFDQDTSQVQFRTRSLPTIVHDGQAFHAFWAGRGFVGAHPEASRILRQSSTNGVAWSAPAVVDSGYTGPGHQIMPAVAAAAGRIQVNWIDTRNNEPGSFGAFIKDLVETDSAGRTFVYRQSGDVFAAQAIAGSAPAFLGTRAVSRYRSGVAHGQRRLLESNFLNARMFKNGDLPFHGDYHAVAARRYLPSATTPGAWVRNVAPSTSDAVFYSAFTDNRDVLGYVWASPFATPFTPVAVSTMEGESGTETPVECVPAGTTATGSTVWEARDSSRSRFQNIYAAVSYPGLIVASPSGSKPTGTLERAYVIFAQNLTPETRTYQFIVANQPPGTDAMPGRAAWRQDGVEASCANAECTILQTTIPRGSSVTRTVYVRSSERRPRVLVRVEEIGGSGQTGSVLLNANPDVAEIDQPDGDGLAPIDVDELYQPDVVKRQSTIYFTNLLNPDVTPVEGGEGFEMPRIEYPRIEYPRIEYPRIEYANPRIEYPRIEYPRIEYPRIEYSSVENPRIEYSALTADDVSGTQTVGITEVTWPVTTDGANTTTAMSAKVFVNGVLDGLEGAQLIVSVPNFVSVTRSCDPSVPPTTFVENQVVVNNIVTAADLAPTSGGPDTVNPPFTEPSFFVRPNQVVYVTLRLVGRADERWARRAGIIVRSQPDTTDGDETDEDMDGAIDTTNPTLDLGGDLEALGNVEANAPGGANVSLSITASDNSTEPVDVSCVRANSDNSAAPVVPIFGEAFFPLGQWTVTCTAVDASGNQASGEFAVNVFDSTPPILDVSGLAGSVGLTPTAGGATLTYDASVVTATDVAGVDPQVTPTCQPPSGIVLPLGQASITCTAVDDSGNSAQASYAFTVADTVPPVITLPVPPPAPGVPGTLVAEATSTSGAVVFFVAGATDVVDAQPVLACQPGSGSTFALGDTPVTCTASDASGNTSVSTFTVRVQDTRAPDLSVPAPITVEASAPGGASVSFVATAVDPGLVDPSPTVTCAPASGSLFPLGTTTVSCTARDASGNVSVPATFTVTVRDTTPPALANVPTGVTAEATSAAGALVAYVQPTAGDLVDPSPTVTCVPVSGALFPLGTTTVSCTARDASGNVSAPETFTVTVRDMTPPTLANVPTGVTAEATSAAGALVAYVQPTAGDLVDPSPTVTCDSASGSLFPLGTTTVRCTARDASGNTSVSTFTVRVEDTRAPVLSLPAPIVVEASGPAGTAVSFVVTAVDPGPVDPSPTVTCEPASGSLFPLGTTTVKCTASDASGNVSALGTFTVTVRDTTPPFWVSAAVTPRVIWPPDGTITPVTVSGQVGDAGSGVVRVEYWVVDEYRQFECGSASSPCGSVAVGASGAFSFTANVLADRRGNDKDGRVFTIWVRAIDAAVNVRVIDKPPVVTIHDQGS